ncbi:MAG TPA: superoxide dismutase family protein [Lacipirellulaceae bacterium]|nr:superoxide dismutase family protein [Lacipirellulaceae bacterium]
MRSATWQLALATGLGIVAATVISYGTHSNAQTAPAARAQAPQAPATAQVTKAIAVVHPLGDSKVGGKVVFTQTRSGVEISAEITGLAPGEHGFHVHEFGDCSMADGTCAGGHFNPTGAPHAGPDDAKRHVGDLGNIKVSEDGKATYKRVDKMVALNGPNSIIGRSVIIHAAPDDLKSQPSGNAGARVGCGVIGIADPKMEH